MTERLPVTVVKRANVVLQVDLCKEIFARKHTATHKPTSAQPTHSATMTHARTHARTHTHVPCVPTYGVYISQLIRFAKACDTYPDFLTRHQRLAATLMRQGFKYDLLCRKFKQFYRSHFDLISRYSKSVT